MKDLFFNFSVAIISLLLFGLSMDGLSRVETIKSVFGQSVVALPCIFFMAIAVFLFSTSLVSVVLYVGKINRCEK